MQASGVERPFARCPALSFVCCSVLPTFTAPASYKRAPGCQREQLSPKRDVPTSAVDQSIMAISRCWPLPIDTKSNIDPMLCVSRADFVLHTAAEPARHCSGGAEIGGEARQTVRISVMHGCAWRDGGADYRGPQRLRQHQQVSGTTTRIEAAHENAAAQRHCIKKSLSRGAN
jgi:hypothetical protein